jgi:perosamine synthetase
VNLTVSTQIESSTFLNIIGNFQLDAPFSKIEIIGPSITSHEISAVNRMMLDGWDNYRYVERFEQSFADLHDRNACLMTPCCTHAIHLALIAFGVGAGDEVIVPAATWTGSVAPVVYCGATPVFADIDPKTWCISAEKIEPLITERTKAVIVVDLYGNIPNFDEIYKLVNEKNIAIIEDAAEALGSRRGTLRAGKNGNASVHSFHRTKTITSGEGGAILSDDPDLHERLRFLRDHGRSRTVPYFIEEVTPKYMPSNLQAALAYAQLERLEELVSKKRSILHGYINRLEKLGGLQFNQDGPELYNGAWATTVVLDKKFQITGKELISKLGDLSIPARPFFYSLPRLPAYRSISRCLDDRNAVIASDYGLTLPSAYSLTEEQLDYICEAIDGILLRRI